MYNKDGLLEAPSEGDGRLIAAAPDLYEACKELITTGKELIDQETLFLYQSAYDKAWEAIKKVEGRTEYPMNHPSHPNNKESS